MTARLGVWCSQSFSPFSESSTIRPGYSMAMTRCLTGPGGLPACPPPPVVLGVPPLPAELPPMAVALPATELTPALPPLPPLPPLGLPPTALAAPACPPPAKDWLGGPASLLVATSEQPSAATTKHARKPARDLI